MENVIREKEKEIRELAKKLQKELEKIIDDFFFGYVVDLESVYISEEEGKTEFEYRIYIKFLEISEICEEFISNIIENENGENDEKLEKEYEICLDEQFQEINDEYAFKWATVNTRDFHISISPEYCYTNYCKVGGWISILFKTTDPELIKFLLPEIKEILGIILNHV